MPDGIQVGVIGAELLMTIREGFKAMNLANATVKEFVLLKPISRTVVEFDASLETDGEDGGLKYVTTAVTDIDEEGWWAMQAYVEKPGFKGYTAIGQFYAAANLRVA